MCPSQQPDIASGGRVQPGPDFSRGCGRARRRHGPRRLRRRGQRLREGQGVEGLERGVTCCYNIVSPLQCMMLYSRMLDFVQLTCIVFHNGVLHVSRLLTL